MRILVRTSKWAIWARRFASLALPLAVLPVFAHRERWIQTSDFHAVELIAMAVAILGFVLSLGAFVRLWITGDQGWGKATIGLVFSLICLLPFGAVMYLASAYPTVTDVTTDYSRPPNLVSATPPARPSAVEQQSIEAAFPNAKTRSYGFEPAELFDIIVELAEQRGWDTRAARRPLTPLDAGQLNAVATTILGWRDEAAVRVVGTAQGSVVDMRSTALHDWSDLGENGRRVEEFLAALDQRITLLLREVPLAAPADPEAEGVDG